jgi:3D (Asp-Asp-Asp) domain-containing protein
VTQDNEQSRRSDSPRRRLRAFAIAASVSLGFAGSVSPKSAMTSRAQVQRISLNELSTPVKGPVGRQPDLSPELFYELPIDFSSLTRRKVTPSAASAIAPATMPAGPFFRGIYVGAAKSRVVWLEVTAYCPCAKCCGPGAAGITASGKRVSYNDGAFVAADADRFAFGAKMQVPGYHEGKVVEVIDRGSAIKGPRVDVYFPTHEEAEAWGRQWLPVTME